MKINGVDVRAIVGSGSQYNFMTDSVVLWAT
jgi:hypothetical protein